MKRPDLRWMAEGAPDEADEILRDGPMDCDKKRAFDEKWISAHDARVRVTKAAGSRIEALALLREAMIGGTIWTRGVPSDAEHRRSVQAAFDLSEADDFQRIPIPPSFWMAATDQDEAKWNWPAGEFSSTPADPTKPSKYFAVEFPAFEIDALCEDNGLTGTIEPQEKLAIAPPAKNDGGRPSGKHGYPIAEIAIRLYQMDSNLDLPKALAVREDLRAAYRTHNAGQPSEDNLLQISGGIIRAVKAARNSP